MDMSLDEWAALCLPPQMEPENKWRRRGGAGEMGEEGEEEDEEGALH